MSNIKPKISVIVPLVRLRGPELDCLKSWTHKQTLADGDYQVVLVTRHEDLELDRKARSILRPNDLWVSSSGSMSRLFDVGARAAAAPLFFFSEGHCAGDSDCLERLLEWAAANPSHAGACVRSHDGNLSEVGEMIGRVTAEHFAERLQGDHWQRVLVRGTLFRREAYFATDGFQHDFSDFTDDLLAAQMHKNGLSIGVADAWVTHYNAGGFADLRDDANTYGKSEFRFRLRSDAIEYERYLAPSAEWCSHLNAMNSRPLFESWILLAALAGVLRSPAKSDSDVREFAGNFGSFMRLILNRVSSAILGTQWNLTQVYMRLAIAHCRYRLNSWLGKDRLPAFKEIWHLYIQEGLLREAARHRDEIATPGLAPGTFDADQIPLCDWLGVYALESAHGCPFRWTQPICRFNWKLVPGQQHEITLDTGGLRRHPRKHLIAAFWNGQRISDSQIREIGEMLILTIRGEKTECANELMLVCMPFTPSRHGSSDPRMLGLPIFGVTCLDQTQVYPRLYEPQSTEPSSRPAKAA